MGKERNPWTLRCLGVFFWLVTAAYAQAAVFTVNTNFTFRTPPGDGVSETAPGNGTSPCARPLKKPTPSRVLIKSSVAKHLSSDRCRRTGYHWQFNHQGGGASTTIIDGNKSVRPNSRVLVAGSGVTVNISGVTIRNGGTGGRGGGIFNVGILTLTNSTVSGNNAGDGGGIK